MTTEAGGTSSAHDFVPETEEAHVGVTQENDNDDMVDSHVLLVLYLHLLLVTRYYHVHLDQKTL